MEFLGKRIVVGLTHQDSEGNIKTLEQFWGTISEIGEYQLTIQESNGNLRYIPYDSEEGLEKAEPGAIYKLKSTGELVNHVDFVSMWVVEEPIKN